MSVLLQVRGAHKRYGDQVLLDGADVTLVEELKVGFIGRNGAGKSTLLKVILGEEELDSGSVTHFPGLRIGYLRQHDPFLPQESALDFLMRDSRQPDWKCGEVAGEFDIKGSYLTGPVKALSGGWQTRVKLAALLLHEPNLLLLDEPTNFLDLRTQILLEHFLRHFPKACLIVSHDRTFLQTTCTHTLDLTRGKLTLFSGRVEEFLAYQQERREHDLRVNAAVAAKQKHLQEFIDKNRARASTATRAKSKSKQLEKLQLLEIETDDPTARIVAPRVDRRSGTALRCTDLQIGYPERTVALAERLEIEHGERAVVVGDNGQGKTTFLRTVVHSLPPLSGQLRWGHGCRLGVYAQHVYSSLPETDTVIEYLNEKKLPGTLDQQVLSIAGALLFRGDQIHKRISVLSGGERARLCLAGLLLGDYNVLVLDEPGNHLDVDTVEALAEALIEYQGTVIFTSHDRHFMRRVSTCVIEVRDGRIKNFGSYDSYLYAVEKELSVHAGTVTPNKKSPPSRKGSIDHREHERDERKLRKELATIERKIAHLDEQRKSLNGKLMQATDPQEALRLHEELERINADLGPIEERWLELQAHLD